MIDDPDSGHARLTTEECWELLENESFGRVAYRLVDEVHLVPLDYAVKGRMVYIRTGAGNRLLAAELDADVALEIDWRGEGAAWSVVARGRLRRLEPSEHPDVELPVRPWVTTAPYEVVELNATYVEGRRFWWDPDPQLAKA